MSRLALLRGTALPISVCGNIIATPSYAGLSQLVCVASKWIALFEMASAFCCVYTSSKFRNAT
jgi:hypothetical protein